MSDLAAANKKEWNDRAEDYDVHPWQQKITAQLTEAIRSRLDWMGAKWASNGTSCSLLDYACGTGMVTRAFLPSITSAHGLDISDSMIATYNSRMNDSNISNATASLGDLVTADPSPPLSDPKSPRDYDIAAVGLGFHHFENPELCIGRLVERLKPETGVCLIIDWLPETHGDGAMDHMKHTIKYHGFDEKRMREIFEGAGLVDFGFVVLDEPLVLEMKGKKVEKTAFLARGRRA